MVRAETELRWRGEAGCRVANMEFNQFHPACLFHPEAKSFLISEAVRGEGGILRLPDGSQFMPGFDPRAEAHSRDIITETIDHEMKRIGADHVYLTSPIGSQNSSEGTFNDSSTTQELDIDMTKDWVPVVPAAHYTCGGVLVDLQGETDLAGLYAVGEVSSTGLHGANRMASNSLLECIVYGRSAGHHIAQTVHPEAAHPDVKPWDASR